MFVPESIELSEAGPGDPYGWLLTETLTWSGKFHGSDRQLEVPASPAHPFPTDLASVPRSLTWLFPRYGRYTKAAVLHDYLCQNFRSSPSVASTTPSLLPLTDRSDADEVFLVVMKELGVPALRRRLMWGAVSWATIMTSLVPGRRSKRVLRWVGRAVVALSLIALVVVLVVRQDLATLALSGVVALAAVIAGGTIALGRGDRVLPYVSAYLLTLLFSPLLVVGLVLGVGLYLYFFVEDAFGGFPATRGFVRNLFSADAKRKAQATPQFARLAAVIES